MSKIFILIFSIFIILFNQILRLSANDDTYINSSNITYNESENIVELAENSKINYKKTNILIDKGIIDYNKNEFEVFGNFYLYEELTILSGQNLKGNTSIDVFSANNVSYIYNDDLKIDSDNLERNKNLVYFYNNFLTPCKLDGYFNCPTWSLRIDKTVYDIEDDKFTHFDTFLQIADYKVFYLPYFTHYGAKAPRKKGFLTPNFEFEIGGDFAMTTPYYIPLNNSTDINIKPKIYFNETFEILKKYQINTTINSKNSEGNTSLEIDNIKNKNKSEINTSIRLNTKKIINKNRVFSASGLFTNSISSTRSINEDPITFEDIFIKLENYNFILKNDYLNTELSSVTAFNSSSSKNIIPISPFLNYTNSIKLKDKTLNNDLNFIILKRSNLSIDNPNESMKIILKNELIFNRSKKNMITFNKLKFINSINNQIFEIDSNLNNQSIKSFALISSDIFYQNKNNIIPRLKIILPLQINNTDKKINEDSESITFNYQNQFSENRYFGTDQLDSTPRLVFGIENQINIKNQKFNFKINQSYDFNKNNSYASKVNQNSNLSDYSFESQTSFNNLIFKIDSRLDSNNFSKREMNYSLVLNKPINLIMNYNETKAEAFKNLSSDNKTLDIYVSKSLNDNIEANFRSNLDINNNYSPYKSSINLSFFDECSQLDITYSNTKFNDNFNTKPEETVGISFKMDYLGFFGYEQTQNIFFDNEYK